MRVQLSAALAAALLVLAGCGGGDDETPGPAQAADGLWIGSTGSNRTVTGLVFADGSYYVMYSSPGYPNVLGGAVMGQGSMTDAAFTSASALHLNLEGLGVLRASVAATVAKKQSFDGTINSTGIPPVTFTSTYNTDYERQATGAALVGSYAGLLGTSKGKLSATWSVRDSGLSSSLVALVAANGCTAQGTALPRGGANVYNLTLSFGPAPCPLAGQTVNGVAYLRATDKQLFVAAPNADGSDAALLSGTKQ
ncbi:hypothetical protein HHL11_30960 [Ramlibacter sp. G-1-2-2]|uniref:Lipoprotein n=1 Tax=Ramlibacter agri TaxID=2728837 RepID=A0A848HFI9_9BURK|nr:hypothetical protein [Ramlibacter agri]NML48209.1 hypothetical protein [Ramlibacter agri]